MIKQFKFNEQAAIENMMRLNFVDRNNITNTIYSLAKYNFHVLHLKDKVNYSRILIYITDNCPNIYEESIYEDIEGCIKSAKKHTLATITEVCITRNEFDVVENLENIRQKKAIFVILAVAKYFNALNNKNYDAVFLTNSDICKMAKITIPVGERDKFMQFAYDKELLLRHTWADSIIKKISFVSHDDNDEIVLRLNESDFLDLANTYLAYIEPHKFKRCFRCKKWIRSRNKTNELCKECRENDMVVEKDPIKTVKCVDCGVEMYLSVLNTETCRCGDCYATYRKIKNLEAVKRYQSKIKNSSAPIKS